MSRAEWAFPSLILTTVAAFSAGGILIGQYSWDDMVFPLGAAVAVCVLCATQIASCLMAGAALPAQPEPDDSAPFSFKSFAWLFALAPFLYVLGFVFGSCAYLLACLRAHGVSWRLSAGIAAASLMVTWGLFVVALEVQLPIAPTWWG
jgi:hypothetical protein